VPGLNVLPALAASRTPAASAALTLANRDADENGIDGTPSFLIGRAGETLRQFAPSSLSAAPFESVINQLLNTKGS
jgi:hypothetical protein